MVAKFREVCNQISQRIRVWLVLGAKLSRHREDTKDAKFRKV